MTDGAAFSMLMSAEKAKELKLKPIARLAYFAVAGCLAEEMELALLTQFRKY